MASNDNDHAGIAVPECSHRISLPGWERYGCTSKKLVHSGSVAADTCRRCPYHELLPIDFLAQTNRLFVQEPPVFTPRKCGTCPDLSPPTERPPARSVPVRDMSETRRHLTYHIWPTTQHDQWIWNLRQLSLRWDMFNGKKIVGIVYGGHRSHMPSRVLDECSSLGMTWDEVIVKRNRADRREVVTWVPMLEKLSPESAAENEVVFSAHAKGVRYHAVHCAEPWARLMYAACLDDWNAVKTSLTHKIMTGPFRGGRDHSWHFSGTFFWWRLKDIGARNWRYIERHSSGTETWPAVQCHIDETACLFLDGCGSLYDMVYWRDVVWPAWAQHQRKRQRASSV